MRPDPFGIDKKLVRIGLSFYMVTTSIICSVGEELVKITKEASKDKFQRRFKQKVQAKSEN